MSKIKSYLSLIKFSHTIFAMPFALIGFFLGGMYPITVEYGVGQWNLNKSIEFDGNKEYSFGSWSIEKEGLKQVLIIFILVILCMVFARSAAMAFNRYLDRHFDAKNPRTAVREIPSGVITPKNALIFFPNSISELRSLKPVEEVFL